MAIVAADLVLFASASMPVVDTGSAGGAIDLLRRCDYTQLAADDDVEVISSSASDTQNCTIVGRTAAGAIVTETVALTGTTAKIFSGNGVCERILSVELASAAIGTITVRRSVAGATIRAIPIGERGFQAVFQQLASDPSAQKDFFSKVFFKNVHGTLTLTAAVVKQNADPDARVNHLLAAAKGDTATSTNRITVPNAADTLDPDTFDDTDKNVPSSSLAAGESIGVWLRLRLPTADPPHRTTYTLELTGTST